MSSSGSGIIFQWLDRIGLGAVVPLFEQRGINSPQLLMKLDEADYPSIGVTGGAWSLGLVDHYQCGP